MDRLFRNCPLFFPTHFSRLLVVAHAEWVTLCSVSPYKHYILIKNHYNKLHHLLPAWLETQIQQWRKTFKTTLHFLFIFQNIWPCRAQAVGQGRHRKISWYTSQRHSCLCMCCTEKYCQIPLRVFACYCNVRCPTSDRSNDRSSFSGL